MESSSVLEQFSGAKVLVVDDNERLRVVLSEVLKTNGYEVVVADGVPEAISFLEASVPDIIICDIMMPETDGYQFKKIIENNSKWNNVPFIFLTALSSTEDMRKGKESGVDDYLTKPFNPQDLFAVIQGKIYRSRQRNKLAQRELELHNRRTLHTLSHEFRTPLVSINTGAELLLEVLDETDRDTMKQLLESVYRGGQRLQRLVEDFMLLQQIDSGHAELTHNRFSRPISLIDVVETAIGVFKETLFERVCEPNIRFFKPQYLERYVVTIYDIHIINVIQRLLSNAYKFGGPESPIEVWLDVNEQEVSAIIRDLGPGMPEWAKEDACKLFTQIERDKNEQQGCGIGLTIAQYFTELNGGKIVFRSPKAGPGLEAHLKFPLKR